MKKIYIEFKWAVIFTIALLSWMLLEKTLGWHEEQIADQWWLTLLFLPFAVLLYLLALREKRRRVYGGKLSWLQGFISGVILSVFVALLSPLAQYITQNYITPQYFNNVIEYSITNDLMTRNKANDYFNINSYIWQSILGALGFGITTAALVAIFARKK
jgi:membrane glycosyltransferase